MPDVGCEIVDVRHIFGTLIVANLCHSRFVVRRLSQMGHRSSNQSGKHSKGKSSAPSALICGQTLCKKRRPPRGHGPTTQRMEDSGYGGQE